MLPPELSKIAKDTFDNEMAGKVRFSKRAGENWAFSDDLYRAVNAAVESVLLEVQELLEP